jgi:HK97 family phage major capsid protein
MSVRLDALRKQHNDIRDGVNVIESKATSAGRDLTDDEQRDVDKLYERAEQLLPEIEAEAKRVGSMDAAAAVLARVAPQQLQTRSAPAPAPAAMTAGEWMVLHIRAKKGDEEATELLTRAVAGQVTADTPGIMPTPIIGPVMSFTDNTRPVWNSFTSRPMPGSGKVFSRPKITQHVNVAEQANELDELVSRKMTIAGDNVTKRTFGGVLELSEQDVDFTDPAAMQLVVQDFVDVFAGVEEAVATAALVALAAAPTSPWTVTNIGTIISSITTAATIVYNDSKKMPDTLWLSMDEAMSLAGLSNATTNVSAMSLIRQALNDAGMPLNIVIGPQLPVDTRIIGASSLVESYEQIKGLITAPDISHLGVVMGYRGYLATFGYASGFVAMV